MLNQNQICACWIWHNGFGVRSQQCYNGATVWMPTPRPPLAASLPEHLLLPVSLRPYAASVHGCAQIRKHTCIYVGRSATPMQVCRSEGVHEISCPSRDQWSRNIAEDDEAHMKLCLANKMQTYMKGNVQSPAEYESHFAMLCF